MVSRNRNLRRTLVAVAVVAGALASSPAWSRCADWDPLAHTAATAPRPISAENLIQIVNIGRADGELSDGPSPIAVSPDGTRAAIILERADIASNRYCQALVRVDLTGNGEPAILDRGGDFQVMQGVFRGTYVTIGASSDTIPAWAPDGSAIAYLRRDHGLTQLWRAGVKGAAAAQVTHEPTDVDDWAWIDSRHIVFATHLSLLEIARERDREGLSGWHYDERVTPNTGPWPEVPGPLPTAFQVIDLGTGATRPALAAETKSIETRMATASASSAKRADGARAWLAPISDSIVAPHRVHTADAAGTDRPCLDAACEGNIGGLWWDKRTHQLLILKREGWNDRYSALYRWTPGVGTPQRLFRTDDVVSRCAAAGDQLLCVHEGAKSPPQLVAVDPRDGAISNLFDPNPGFNSLQLGSVQRLTWRSKSGAEAYGDLVLPPSYKAGTRVPLIVTMYQSEGFLRGATGDEYPIFLFAERGFAVLSIDQPPTVASRLPGIKTGDDFGAANLKGWAEARDVQSAIEAGVAQVVASGIADPRKIGITGLSAGASAARFALLNSKLFAAASISSCCVDEYSDMTSGPAWQTFADTIGYPPAVPVSGSFWKPASLAYNAATMDTPLLMQQADREYIYGLPTITALRTYNQPVDLYVFPDEYHIKWQPAHRLAIYERNIDWFSFWLQGKEISDSEKTAQYERWRALRHGGGR